MLSKSFLFQDLIFLNGSTLASRSLALTGPLVPLLIHHAIRTPTVNAAVITRLQSSFPRLFMAINSYIRDGTGPYCFGMFGGKIWRTGRDGKIMKIMVA